MITSRPSGVFWLILPGGSSGVRMASFAHLPVASVPISYSKPLTALLPRALEPPGGLGGEAQGTAGGHLDNWGAVWDLDAPQLCSWVGRRLRHDSPEHGGQRVRDGALQALARPNVNITPAVLYRVQHADPGHRPRRTGLNPVRVTVDLPPPGGTVR